MVRGLRAVVVALAVACAGGALAANAAHAGPSPAKVSPVKAAVVVIVHPSVSAQVLSYGELRDLVLGKRRYWSGDARVELVVAGAPSLERRWWVEVLSGMSEVQFRQYWIGEVFRGRATSAPRAVPDRRTAVALVGVVPGAIALVEEGQLPANVRAIPVDGRTPASPDYPLR